ncbi:MAG TPA: glycosyltransferase family 87 protein [Pyrinomonadaceae bacterium]|nr:DUF2029 domain-containing protein [Chloracidobacterium sp.]HRJ90040.1 glycosyltransferase family 87 protein [Pyrinomonadaceae bacterium]HRK50919.1 glycosyltransferase family 87 protein [Pyrinomonadaceae bacterium]
MKSVAGEFIIDRLRTDTKNSQFRRLTYLLLLLILCIAIVGIALPAGLGWDFANFYDTGRRAASWQISDLYKPESLIDGEMPQGKLSFWGAPISALFYMPLGLFSAELALVLFKIQNTLACFAALYLTYLQNRRYLGSKITTDWRFAALFAGIVLIFQPIWSIYRIGGQTTPTVFLLFSIALHYYMREKFRLSSICIALALLIKPGFVFVLLPLGLVSGWKFLREILLIFTVIGLFSFFLLGWNVHYEFLKVMMLGSVKAFSWQYNSSLYVMVENLRFLPVDQVNPEIIGALLLLVKLSVVVLFGLLFWTSRTEHWTTASRSRFNFLMSITFCLMISQTVWEHYLIILFPLLAYIVANHTSFSLGARILVAIAIVMSFGQNIVFVNFLEAQVSFDTIPELVLIGLLKSCPLWLIFTFLLKYRVEFFRSFVHPK